MTSLLQDITEKIYGYFQNSTIAMKKPYTVEVQGIRVELEPPLRDDRFQQSFRFRCGANGDVVVIIQIDDRRIAILDGS